MFEACASLLYPALKENIEAILPWTVLLRVRTRPDRAPPVGDEPRPRPQPRVLRSAPAATATATRPRGSRTRTWARASCPAPDRSARRSTGQARCSGPTCCSRRWPVPTIRRSSSSTPTCSSDASLRGDPAPSRRFSPTTRRRTSRTPFARSSTAPASTTARRSTLGGRVAGRSIVDDRPRGGAVSRPLGIGLVGAGRFGAFCVDAFADLPGRAWSR